MKNRSTYYIGIILVIVGSAAFYNSVFLNGYFGIQNMWPMFILLPGLFLEMDYFSRRSNSDAGILIPAGILIGMGIWMLFREFLPLMDGLTVPVFIAVVGLSLLQYFIAKPRDRGILVVSLALILIGALLGISRYTGEIPIWLTTSSITSLAVIMLGLYLLARRPADHKDSTFRPRERSTENVRDSYKPGPGPAAGPRVNTNPTTHSDPGPTIVTDRKYDTKSDIGNKK
jgi:hypothetical protein